MGKRDNDNGQFYDEAHAYCLKEGYDTTQFCGVENKYSYYYLSESKRKPGKYGIPFIVKINNKTGELVEVWDTNEAMKAFYMARERLGIH